MYRVIKVGNDIFVSSLLIQQCAYFHAKDRDPSHWVLSFVTKQDYRNDRVNHRLEDYIAELPDAKKAKWEKFFLDLKAIAGENDSLLQEKIVKGLNEEFRGKTGSKTSNEYLTAGAEDNYSSHCWNCKDTVDSDVNLKHGTCGWLICAGCGACGCGYDDKHDLGSMEHRPF